VRRTAGREGAALVVVVIAMAVAGCDSGVGIDEFLSRDLASYCKLQVDCNFMPDTDSCMASLRLVHGYQATIKQDIASGKVKYDAEKAGACIDMIERYTSCSRSDIAAVGDLQGHSAECLEMFSGTVAVGGACFFSAECADGGSCSADATCSNSEQCCAGTCVAKLPTVPVGGDCAAGSCAPGTVCIADPSGIKGTCQPPPAEGAACMLYTQCAAALYCDIDWATGMGVCRRPAKTGAGCNFYVGSTSCDDRRDYCDMTTGTCTRRVGSGGDCSAGQTCVAYSQCGGTTCVALPGPGQSCDATAATPCLGALQCDSSTSTCTPPPQDAACM